MDCPKCGTWNPDDKVTCWRCTAELPKPKPPKPKRRVPPATWLWILVAVMVIIMVVQTCVAFQQLR